METGVDDPDRRGTNYPGCCNPEFDKLVDEQSMQADPEQRKQIVWQLARILAEAAIQPVIFYRLAAPAGSPG